MKHLNANDTVLLRSLTGIEPPRLYQLVIFALLTFISILLVAGIFSPKLASANPGKTTPCLNCHTAENTGASIFVAVEGAEWNTASNYVLSSYTGSVLDVEIDYVFKDNTNSAAGESIALWVATPSGWAITPGTVNSPTGTNFGANWHTAWDIATSNLSTTETYYTVATGDTSHYPSSPDSYSIYWNNITGSGWNVGKNKGAFDDASAGDLDGMAETMGTDFRITVPAGLTAGTTHQIVVHGIGHTSSNTKAYVRTTLTLEIPSGGGDAIEPTSAITDPVDSAFLNSSSADPYTVIGTASDNDAVSLVEVSINGGAWQAATDTGGGTWATWSYSWTLPADGPYTIQSRATDASSNLEGAGAGNAGISVTVDRAAPTFGGVTGATDAGTGGAVDLTWTAATDANPPITYNIYWSATSGGQNFTTPDATSTNATGDSATGLVDDQIYYFVVRAEDNGGNEELNSTELSATPTAPVPCVYATPTVTILTVNKEINTDGGFVKYRIRVTNNDSATCSPTSFNITLSDSNVTNFYPSLSDINPLNVTPLSSAETTMQVTAKANQTNGATNDTFFYTEADGNHAQSANSNSVTTTISVTGAGCLTDGSFLNANGDQLIISR